MIDGDQPRDEVNLLRLPRVLQRVGLSRATVYRLIQKDEFPSPVRLGSASAWPDKEIDSWIDEQMRKR